MVGKDTASPTRTRERTLSLLRLGVLAAVAATALGGFLQAAPQGHAAVDAGAATTADAGYRDFSFGTSGSAPTAKDQQSKLWFNDGLWWGSLLNSSALKFQIYKLDSGTQTWSATSAVIDTRSKARSDTFWDATANKLYVVTHGLTATTSTDRIRLLRFSYDSSSKTYTQDAGFPVDLNTGGTAAATIDKDTTGTLWVTYTQSSKVWVTHSTGGSDSTWVAPYVLPLPGPDPSATNLLDQDESAIVSYNGKIGIMWGNQNTSEWAYYFATHVDGAADSVWTKTIALKATEESDNHMNLKSLDGDPAGQVFASVKTSLNAADAPLYYLLVLRNDGTWVKQVFGTVADDHTRAQVALDPVNRRLFMFGTSPCCSGGSIYYKETSLDAPSFSPGKGTPLIENGTDTHINNPSTTKQPLTNASQLVVEASDDASDFYVHGTVAVGPDLTPPDTTITSGPAGTVATTSATFTFGATEGGSTFQCKLDGGAFAACTSPKAYSGLVEGTHTFQVRAIDPLGNTDPTPAVRTWVIDTTTQDVTFSATADAFVEQGSPTTNFGTDSSLVADDSPNTETFIRFAPSALAVTGVVVSAKLRLFVTNATNNGPALYSSNSTWSEAGVTWNTRPVTVGGIIEDKGAIPNRTWAEYDVSTVVTGNGTYSFRLDPTSTDGIDFYSRESTNANKPQLVVTVDNDTIAPDTTVESGPTGSVNNTAATFSFSSNEPGSTFRCSLDLGPYSACTSPRAYSGLAQGQHTFSVKALDPAGNEDPTPATRTWTVDVTAPAAPVITSPSANSTFATGTVTVSGTTEGLAAVQILDGPTLAETTTADGAGAWSVTLVDVADGSHALTARATDAAGNTSPSSNATTILVDSVVPETAIDSGPTGVVRSTSATFTFSADEAGVSFQCKLDAGAFAPCASPSTHSNLGQGTHSFEVRAADAAGNTDATPAVQSWAVDTIAPAAPVIASPADNSTSASTTITVSGTVGEPGAAIAVFDGVTSVGGTTADGTGLWSVMLSGVSDGPHTYTATATDAVGNTSAASNSSTVTVDTVPIVTDVLPTDGATNVPVNSRVTATFSEAMDAASITASTFTVLVQSGGTPVPAQVSYDAVTRKATLDPQVSLAPGTTYSATVAGGPTGVKDLSGSGLAADKTWSFTTDALPDTTPPETTIDSSPSGPVNSTSASFAFSSNEAGSTFECRLDGGAFAACTSPHAYSGLTQGPHTFQVRATDAAGNVDPSPADRTWTVDTTAPPAPSILSPSPGATNVNDLTVSGGAEAFSTVELFDGAASAGTVPVSEEGGWSFLLTDVPDGAHVYTAKAKDTAGNTSGASNALSVTVDTAAPDTTIDAGPNGPTASTAAQFAFSSEAGSSYQCSLDGATPAGCTSPKSYADLGQGAHTFTVRASDPAGNTDASPATRSWTVDTVAPAAPAITAPANNSTNTTGTIVVSGTAEPAATVEIFDGAASQGTTAADGAGAWTKTLSVSDGSHTYTAKARDAAGNVSPSSNSRTVSVDATAPETTINSGPSGTTTSTSAAFTFSSNDPTATFACSLDGATFAACTSPQPYTGLAEGPHTFSVRATDALGNTDGTPASGAWTISLTLFSDGFESGTFSAWTSLLTGGDGTAVVQSATVKTGTFAAQLAESATTGSFAYARKTLGEPRNEVRVKGDFQIQLEGASGGNVPLIRLFDTAGTRIMSLYRQNLDGSKIRVTHSGVGSTTSGVLPLSTWGQFELHVSVPGTVEVFQNGVLIYQTLGASLGTNPISVVQIGNETKAQAFRLVADDITVRP